MSRTPSPSRCYVLNPKAFIQNDWPTMFMVQYILSVTNNINLLYHESYYCKDNSSKTPSFVHISVTPIISLHLSSLSVHFNKSSTFNVRRLSFINIYVFKASSDLLFHQKVFLRLWFLSFFYVTFLFTVFAQLPNYHILPI